MSIRTKLSKGENVECMIIENGGRSIRRDGVMQHVGDILNDDFLQEAYAVVTKPLLSFKKKGGGIPVYLIDRNAGVTVYLEKEETGKTQRLKFESTPENPIDITINGKSFAGWTTVFERAESVIKIKTNASLVGRAIKSELLRDQFSAPLSGREKMIMLLVGIIIGGVIGLMF
ncbi:hypothetical protein F1737_09035 [Methanoplanus sp. FWC-SCC4]|uniref:Uncharacterized protein n=1 Tax=Methanochimaera problematica TaxID=2609417 RepID=A0AA97FF02_9EURY|nr:hypothetical protein [Methanoplanus sp. FWC-SCC4]WOF16823.1 hypothetical protein F1737_09035 [Methanoplanus sp. FWC-SCC4]